VAKSPVNLIQNDYQELNGVTSRGTSIIATEVIQGATMKDWRAAVVEHRDATLPYYRTRYQDVRQGWVRNSTQVSIPGRLPSTFVATVPLASPPPEPTTGSGPLQSCDNIALSILKRKMQDDYQQFRMALPLAEINEARRLHVDVSKSLHNTLSSMNRLYLSLGGNKAKLLQKTVDKVSLHAADLWLAWGFGVSPTLADIRDLSKSLDDYFRKEASFIEHYTASYGTTWFDDSAGLNNTTLYTAADSTGYYRKNERTYRGSVQYKCGLVRRIANTSDYSLAMHLGWSPGEIVSGLWEATAFSWVADYIGTMGEFLEDNFSVPPGNTTYVSKTVRSSVKCVLKTALTTPSPSSGWKVLSAHNDSSMYRVKFLRRTKLTSIPKRALAFRSSDDILYHWQNKLANILSVVRGRIH